MEELTIVCPKCGRMFDYIPEAAGRYMHCHGCHHDIPVPLTTITPSLNLNDEYIVESKLGAGNISDVFVVRDLKAPKRYIRMKALTLMATRDKETTGTFFKAMAKVAEQQIPEVPKILEFGQAADIYYYVGSPYHEGQTLDQIVSKNGPLSEDDAMAYLMQLVSLLQRLWHNHAFIHRNLRPGNVLITPDGEMILLDAGADKRLLVGNATGMGRMNIRGDLMAYTAPELLGANVEVDPRVDIYALGGILLYLLTGHDPVAEDSSTQTIRRFCQEAGVKPSKRCIQFVRAAMADDPNMRPGNWKETLLMLRRTTDSRTDAGTREQSLSKAIDATQLMTAEEINRQSSADKPKRSLLVPALCAILSLILLGGVGGIIYFVIKNRVPLDEEQVDSRPKFPDRPAHEKVETPTPKKPAKRVEPGITAAYLVDSQTGKDVFQIKNNGLIHMAQIPSYVAIRVAATTATRSVHFIWQGREIIDSTPPFALTGEKDGSYTPWNIKDGVYSFSASSWSRENAGGRRGSGKGIKFYVVGTRTGPANTICSWTFDTKDHGWQSKKRFSNVRIEDGVLKAKVASPNPFLIRDKLSLPAHYIRRIIIRMRSTKAGVAQFRFVTSKRDTTRNKKSAQATFGDNQWHEYTFKTDNFFEKDETLKILRFGPINGSDLKGAEIEIDWIKLLSD